MKQEILILMKQQLRNIVDKLTMENFKEMEGQIHRVFTILESSETMIDTHVHQETETDSEEQILVEEDMESVVSLSEIEKETEEFIASNPVPSPPKKEKSDARKSYRFIRKIKGGMVSGLDAFVPEGKIRDLDLHNGDRVYANFLFKPTSGPTRYDYEIASRLETPEPTPGIVEIDMGIVSFLHGRYVIARTVNEDFISLNGEKLILPILLEDAEAMDLREDDVVSAAFYENNPEYTRVRWKYFTEEDTQDTSASRPPSYYKTKEKVEKEELEQTFSGKTIAILGYKPGWAAYREEIQKRGGEIVTFHGRESTATLSSIRKSDGLVMILGHVGHAATIWAVDFCKKEGIPQVGIKTFGRSSFVDAATSLFEK